MKDEYLYFSSEGLRGVTLAEKPLRGKAMRWRQVALYSLVAATVSCLTLYSFFLHQTIERFHSTLNELVREQVSQQMQATRLLELHGSNLASFNGSQELLVGDTQS